MSGADLEEWNTLSYSGEVNHPCRGPRGCGSRCGKASVDEDLPNALGYRGGPNTIMVIRLPDMTCVLLIGCR